MKAGIIKWFDPIKGFGVIGTPNNGEAFLHKSNYEGRLEDLGVSRLFIFEEFIEKGKVSAKKVHIPSTYEDFTIIMNLLDGNKVVNISIKVSKKNKWGKSYIDTETKSFNILAVGLSKICKNIDFKTLSEWINTYYIEELSPKKYNYFIDFCQFIEKITRIEGWSDFPINDNFTFFGKNLNSDILFSVWINKAFKFIGYGDIGDLDDIEVPEGVLWEKREILDHESLKRIFCYDFGERFLIKYFDWLIDQLKLKNLIEFKKINPYEKIKILSDVSTYFKIENELNEITKEIVVKEIKAGVSQMLSDDDYEKFERLFGIIPSSIPNSIKSELDNIVQSLIIESCSKEVAFKLWYNEKISEIDFGLVKTDFEEKNLDRHSKIFRLIKISNQRIELVKILILKNNWDYIFDLLNNYLRFSNSLGYGFSLKEKLFDVDFWKDKNDIDLLNEVIEGLNNVSDPELITDLYLKGYMKIFPQDYVFATLECYDINQIKKFLAISESAYSLKVLKKRIELAPDRKDKFATLTLGINILSPEEFKKLDEYCFEITNIADYYEIWLKKIGKIFPEDYIITLFNDNESNYEKIDEWVDDNLVSINKIETLLFDKLKIFKEIDDRIKFYTAFNIINKLTQINSKWNDEILTLNNSCFQIMLWHLGQDSNFNFEALKTKFIYFKPESQILIIKKLFRLKKKDVFDLTINRLEEIRRISLDIYRINEVLNPEIPLDISTDLVIESLKSYIAKGKFLVDTELITVVLRNLYGDKKRKFHFGQYFEKCQGRLEGDLNWRKKNGTIKKVPFGEGRFYFKIEFPYDANLVEKVRNLPGRRWNNEEQHWGVPSTYEKEVLEFAHNNRFFLDFGENDAENNLHFAKFERKGIPAGIEFCEGKISQNEDTKFRKKFWWCSNQRCFGNCETIHGIENWEDYTLLDFCKILDINLDEDSRYGFFPNGHYYQFISLINRFNRLLERMYCRSCEQILYPVEGGNYAAYTVVKFACQNENCLEHRKPVYLNHCLNGKCNSIIDSRDSKKCHYEDASLSGMYICSNCGSCCSHEMLSKRLQNLESTGGLIHPELRLKVDKQLGHLERAEYFCYKCGKDMTEYSSTLFKCNDCQIEYDLNKFKFNYPHKHLRRNNYPTAGSNNDF